MNFHFHSLQEQLITIINNFVTGEFNDFLSAARHNITSQLRTLEESKDQTIQKVRMSLKFY